MNVYLPKIVRNEEQYIRTTHASPEVYPHLDILLSHNASRIKCKWNLIFQILCQMGPASAEYLFLLKFPTVGFVDCSLA
jgi:hypothetical protein